MIARTRNSSIEEINKWISYHSEITQAMVAERTALESKLIPVTAYIIISAVECYRRYPELMEKIESAMSPEEIGRAGRVPGNQIDAVHLWSLPNFFLTGRQALITMQKITPDHEPERMGVLFDFWRRAAEAYRGDGAVQAWDAGMTLRPYPQAIVDRVAAETQPVDGEVLDKIRRFSSTLMTYLFLLYFDTRVGTGDTGPYELPDGKVLLLRDFTNAGRSFFPWSEKVASNMPYSNMTAAFVLEDVKLKVNDWGTSITDPEFYLDRVVGFALFTSDGTEDGKLKRLSLDELEPITEEAKKSRSDMYRLVAGMSRKEKIDSGAFVYFTFLRPFAEAAGLAESIDWTVPQASLDVYDILSMFEGSGESSSSGGLSYYMPIP